MSSLQLKLSAKMKKLSAKQTHGLIETLLFVSIILTCFFLVLRTSIRTENISKHGKCAYKNKRGLVGNGYFVLIVHVQCTSISDFRLLCPN